MTVTFVGHSLVLLWDRVMEVVKEKIRNCISECKSVTFYLGGYGEFDKLCASACRELKREREGIDLVYVTPYFELKDQKKISELQRSGLYDSSIYPPIERVPPRFAIVKRNEWMIDKADLVIAYVDHSYGGAYKSFMMAKRKGKRIINVCDFL